VPPPPLLNQGTKSWQQKRKRRSTKGKELPKKERRDQNVKPGRNTPHRESQGTQEPRRGRSTTTKGGARRGAGAGRMGTEAERRQAGEGKGLLKGERSGGGRGRSPQGPTWYSMVLVSTPLACEVYFLLFLYTYIIIVEYKF
jgi:hypothetical protein